MADQIFQKAWAHYIDLIEFLAEKPGPIEGVLQPFNLATLLSYSASAQNYNLFLLLNACNFVAPTSPVHDNSDNLENRVPTFPSKLDQAYGDFLVEFDDIILKAIDPSSKPAYLKLQTDFQGKQTEYNNYVTIVEDEWQRHIARHPEIPVENYESERRVFERDRGFSAELQRRRRAIRLASGKLNAFSRKNSPRQLWPIIDAKTYYEDENFQVRLPTTPIFDSPNKKDLWRYFQTQNPIFDLDEFLKNDNFVSRAKNTVDETYSRVETNWGANTKFSWGVFGGSASAESREMEEISKRTEFTFEVGFKRIQEVEISRAEWYQDVLFSTLGKQFPQYWGPNGTLAAIPYTLLIGRGTKIKVTISDEYKRTLEKFFKAGGSFGFGGFFSLGGSYSKDEKYMNYTSLADGFTLEDDSKTIRLLGARVRRFNWPPAPAVQKYYGGLDKTELDNAVQWLEALTQKTEKEDGSATA